MTEAPGPVALALSPHLDDAAFSCGGTLALLARRGWRVVIATLFTQSVPEPTGFALACQLDKGLGPEVDYMALRRDEDARSCAALGAEPAWLPFQEAPHRGYGSAPELFAALRDDDAVGPALTAAIADLAARHRPALILATQAIGGHVDHVQVVRALDAVAPSYPILWWRDFPYSVKAADREPLRERFAGLPEIEMTLDEAALAAKRDAALAYASQLGFQFGDAAGWDRLAASSDGRERFRLQGAWLLDLADLVSPMAADA
ncbi:PIG-L deacetylase family protein [uncultured Enterovirga sp.]|uniref:PIG-L deacetylase family protein n=1 Tax=uncultured Enterovirga sp. TaxID=2026352 RepID=UPI0035CAF3EA